MRLMRLKVLDEGLCMASLEMKNMPEQLQVTVHKSLTEITQQDSMNKVLTIEQTVMVKKQLLVLSKLHKVLKTKRKLIEIL